jgi:hypothetical protein
LAFPSQMVNVVKCLVQIVLEYCIYLLIYRQA